jgi:hypothetical protein
MIRLSALLIAVVILQGARPQAPDARSLLDLAVSRAGGVESLRTSGTWIVEGEGTENLTAEAQGVSANAPTNRPHRERVAANAARNAVAWERHTPRNDASLRWRRFIYRDDSSGVVVWTDSAGSMNGNVASEVRRRSFVRRVPHLLLLEAATRGRELSLGAERRFGGEPAREVRVVLDDTLRVSLWIGRDSPLRAAEYDAWLPGRGGVKVRWEWEGWSIRRNASPLLAPTGHRVMVNDMAYQTVRSTNYASGSAAGDSLLSVPPSLAGRRMSMTMNAPRPAVALPVSGEVSPGVHVFGVRGFNVMVVEFATFVVLVEAPAVHPGFESIPPVAAPDLGADVGSVAAIAALGPTFVVDRESRIAAERMFRAANLTAPKMEVVRDRFEIADSTRTLVAWNVGANPHTSENLFAWLPRERIGFQGDLFYYDAAGGAPADRAIMNRFFSRWIAAKGLSPRGVYGVHSAGAADSAAIAEAGRR